MLYNMNIDMIVIIYVGCVKVIDGICPFVRQR